MFHTQRVIVLFLAATLVAFAAAAKEKEKKKDPKKETAPVQAETPKKPEAQAAGLRLEFPLRHNIAPEGKPAELPLKETKDWVVADFVGRANVRVEGDTVILEKGNDMTGIVWKGPLVRMNYEVNLDAKRVEGSDFFCGLTFPYNDKPCSLIVGGWGGTLVGISSLDHEDAANNETGRTRDFETGRWYHIRLRISPDKIQAWIDDEQLVDVVTTDRKIDIRWEVEPSVPFGIATWQTTGAIKNIAFEAFKEPPKTDSKS